MVTGSVTIYMPMDCATCIHMKTQTRFGLRQLSKTKFDPCPFAIYRLVGSFAGWGGSLVLCKYFVDLPLDSTS